MPNSPHILEASDRVLSTLEKDGSRRWMFPKLSCGRFWNARRIVAYFLVAAFTLIPFLKIGGRPVLLLDLAHRRFSILGHTFLPTDTILLAVFVLTTLLSIFFITALLGRVWCGWACPQTVYMEFVFRPIERLFTGRTGRGGKPGDVAAWRRVLLYVVYFIVCLHLANTFLAYFVPPKMLHAWITSGPNHHPAGFVIVLAVTGLMMFDFAFFREQTCIIACPYGRLQSVLLDRQSLIISYDEKRGEPRGKKKKIASGELPEKVASGELLEKVASCELPVASKKAGLELPILHASQFNSLATNNWQLATPSGNSQLATPPGDCIDCDMCVQVCPTGIDIRQGLQVECVACAQCIDACDTVMDKIDRPRGLIRYSSQAAMAGEKTRLIRPRVIVYIAIVTVLAGLLSILLTHQAVADVTVLRNPGRPFAITPDKLVENMVRVKITNRTDSLQRYNVSVADRPEIGVFMVNRSIEVAAGESVTEPVRLVAPASLFKLGHLDAKLHVDAEPPHAGEARDDAPARIVREIRLLGPSATSNPTEPEHRDDRNEH